MKQLYRDPFIKVEVYSITQKCIKDNQLHIPFAPIILYLENTKHKWYCVKLDSAHLNKIYYSKTLKFLEEMRIKLEFTKEKEV